jgi:hypothetical protein
VDLTIAVLRHVHGDGQLRQITHAQRHRARLDDFARLDTP